MLRQDENNQVSAAVRIFKKQNPFYVMQPEENDSPAVTKFKMQNIFLPNHVLQPEQTNGTTASNFSYLTRNNPGKTASMLYQLESFFNPGYILTPESSNTTPSNESMESNSSQSTYSFTF